MTALDKLIKSQIPARRKLHDYQISSSGTEIDIIFLKVDKNKYLDETVTIERHFITSLTLDIPGEIPITRMRKDLSTDLIQTSSVFFYDVLPTKCYTKFADLAEKGDLFVHRIYMDNDIYYIVFEITETLGNIQNGQLIFKVQQCAPYTKALPQDAIDIINSYKGLV